MGSLRRRIDISTEEGHARGAIEDDFHHFRVDIRHAGGVVTGAVPAAPRHPNSLCPMAGLRVTEIVGLPLGPAASILAKVDARQQCTHVFDLAALTAAAAWRGTPRLTYEIEVTDVVEGQPREARLWTDGALTYEWILEGGTITSPPPFAGRNVASGFTGWVVQALPDEAAEAALALRRGVFISSGRLFDLDAKDEAGPTGGCWVGQPERQGQARRMKGSTHDFTDRPQVLTLDDRDWLSFRTAN